MRPDQRNPFQNGARQSRAHSIHAVTNEELDGELSHLAHPQDAVLFVDKPEMEDVHQGASRQCFIDAALLSIAYSDPYFLTSILCKEGDTVTAHLHRRTENDEFRSLHLVIEHSDFQPRAGKKLHSHAAWASSLIKAYGIMRAKFYTPSTNGKLELLPQIKDGGQPADVFEALTGKPAEVISISQHEEQNLFFKQKEKNQAAVADFVNLLKNALRGSTGKTAETVLTELQKAIQDKIEKNYHALINNNENDFLTWFRFFTNSDTETQNAEILQLCLLAQPQGVPYESTLPTFLLTMARKIEELMDDEHEVHLVKINKRHFTPSETPKVQGTHYDSKLKYIFSKIDTALNVGKYLTASTEEFSSGIQAQENVAETEHFGLVGLHAYAVLGTCKRRDSKGQERCFIRLKNPWQEFSPEYTEDGSRKKSRDSKGLATREYECTTLFGAKGHSSSDYLDPQLPSLSRSAGGLFELELEDFCRHFSTLTLCERGHEDSKLLHDLQAFLATALHYAENEMLRNHIADMLNEFDGEVEWQRPEHLILVLYNQLKKTTLPENYTISEHLFVEFCSTLNDGNTINHKKIAAFLKEYTLKSREIFGYSEKLLLEERIQMGTPKNLKKNISAILQFQIKPADKIIQLYFYLASRLRYQKSDEDKEAIHQLLFDIRQHWKSRLHECSHLIGKGHRVEEMKQQRDFYSYLNETAFYEAQKIIEHEKSENSDEQHYQQIAKQVQAQAKIATQTRLVKLVKNNPWNTAILALSVLSIIVGIALQFSGVGAPVGLLLIKTGYTKFATVSAARMAIVNAVLSTAASIVMGSITQFFVRARQHIKEFFRGSPGEYKALEPASPKSSPSSPEFSPEPSPKRTGSLQRVSSNRQHLFANRAKAKRPSDDERLASCRGPSPSFSSGEE